MLTSSLLLLTALAQTPEAPAIVTATPPTVAAPAALDAPVTVIASEGSVTAEVTVKPADPGKVAQFGFTLFELLSPFFLALLAWLSARVSSLLTTRIKNETLAGILARFTDSVFVAVKRVNQTLRSEIEAAKKPGSPGGTSITKEEAASLKKAVLEELKAEYGGMAGLKTALAVLKLEETPLMGWIDSRIEAAVHDTKRLPR